MGLILPALGTVKTGFRALCKAGVWFSVYFTLSNEVGDWYLVCGHSMETTLSDGQIVLVKPIGNRGFFTEIVKGFIVTFGYNSISVGDVIVAKGMVSKINK